MIAMSDLWEGRVNGQTDGKGRVVADVVENFQTWLLRLKQAPRVSRAWRAGKKSG